MHASFVCPLTHRVMVDPVVAADGRSYERSAIIEWLETHEAAPGADAPLPSKALLPNLALRDAIREAAAKGTEQLPQTGYFIYRSLRAMHACALPSFLHRGMLPNRQPFVIPADELVIVTRRERGAGCNDVFLRTEGNIFLFESEFGVPTAVRLEPLRELRVYRARKITSLTLRPVKFAPLPQTRTLQPGEVISTDMFVHDANGVGFARSESSGSWVNTMFLDLVPPPTTKQSFCVPAATMLCSNCLAIDARVISSTVIPPGTVVLGQTVVSISATKLAVRTTYCGVTGWFEVSPSTVVTASSGASATVNSTTDAPPAKVRRLDAAHVAPSSQPTPRPVAAPGPRDALTKAQQSQSKAAPTSKPTTTPAIPKTLGKASTATPVAVRAVTPASSPTMTPVATPAAKAAPTPVATPSALLAATTPAAAPSSTPAASPAAALTTHRASPAAKTTSRDTTPAKATAATSTKALEASHATPTRPLSMAPTTTASHSFLSPSSVRNTLSVPSPVKRHLQATTKSTAASSPSPSTTKAAVPASAPQAHAGVSGTSVTAAPAPAPVGKMPVARLPTPACTPTPVTSTLPQKGYFIYRTLDRVVLSRTPSSSDRILLASGAPRRLPPNELVVVTQRVRGDVHAPVFLALESDATDPMFLPEAVDGVDVAEVVLPSSDLGVYETIAPTPVTRHPMAPTSTDARLPPGCLLSTDLHVDDMTGGEYVRLEHSTHWVPLASLRPLKNAPGRHSFVMDAATPLVSNAYSGLSVPIAVVPRGTTLGGRIVVDLPGASQCLVRAMHKGATGWFFATRPASLLAAAPVAPKQPRTPVKPEPSSDSDIEIMSPPTTRTNEEPPLPAPHAAPTPAPPVPSLAPAIQSSLSVPQPRQEPLVSVSQQRHTAASVPRRSRKAAASKARRVPPPVEVVPPGRQLKVVLRGVYYAVLHTPVSGRSTILGEYLPLPLSERIGQVCFMGHCITHLALSPDDAWYLSLERSAGAAYTIVSPAANEYVRHHAKPKMRIAFANGRIVLAPEAGPALSRGFAGSILQRRLSSSKKVDILAMDDDGSVFMQDALGHVAHGLSQVLFDTILEPSPVGGGALVDVVLSNDKYVLLYEHTFRASPAVPSVVINLLHSAYGKPGNGESTLDPVTTLVPRPPTTRAPPSTAATDTEESRPNVQEEPGAVPDVKPEPTLHASSEMTHALDIAQGSTAEPDPAAAKDMESLPHPANPPPSRPATPIVVGQEDESPGTRCADAASTPSTAVDDASVSVVDAAIIKAEVPNVPPPPSTVKQEPSAFEFVPSTPSPPLSPAKAASPSALPAMKASPTPPPAPVFGRLHASLLASFEEDDIDVWSIS